MSRVPLLCLAALALAAPARAGDAGPTDGDAGVSDREAPARAPLVATSRMGDLRVDRVVVALERKGDRMEVVETVTLVSREGTRFEPREPLRFGLPPGAVAPKAPGEGEERPGIEADAAGFAVADPIGPDGEAFTLSFEVPIEGGRAAFAQRFPAAIDELQVISTWTRGAARLYVEGCREGARRELESGLTALVTMKPGYGAAALSVTVTGIEDGAEAALRRIALALCAVLAAWGVAAAFVSRRRRRREPPP